MGQFSQVQIFILAAVPILFAITVHEVAHGYIAMRLGDKTAKMLGRLTLNPIKHIDPLGTVVVPILTFFFGGIIFGWAKPVPVSARNLRRPKTDMIWVALAGPVSNLLMALFWAFIASMAKSSENSGTLVQMAFYTMGQYGMLINLILFVLNLIPIPPLDGGRVLTGILPNHLSRMVDRIEPYGIFIILILLVFGVLGRVIFPIVISLSNFLMSLFVF